ncbi:hypothetical protein MWU50_08865 [Flavobacteriaceae bacterium S0862]|nr:hypothetical protein [Flavobacteriaceae bacterium S0862]
MINNKFRYIMIVLFGILLILDFIYTVDYDKVFSWGNVLGPLSKVLMIVAMVLSIKHVNKRGEN